MKRFVWLPLVTACGGSQSTGPTTGNDVTETTVPIVGTEFVGELSLDDRDRLCKEVGALEVERATDAERRSANCRVRSLSKVSRDESIPDDQVATVCASAYAECMTQPTPEPSCTVVDAVGTCVAVTVDEVRACAAVIADANKTIAATDYCTGITRADIFHKVADMGALFAHAEPCILLDERCPAPE